MIPSLIVGILILKIDYYEILEIPESSSYFFSELESSTCVDIFLVRKIEILRNKHIYFLFLYEKRKFV